MVDIGHSLLVGVVCLMIGYWLGLTDLKRILDDDDDDIESWEWDDDEKL